MRGYVDFLLIFYTAIKCFVHYKWFFCTSILSYFVLFFPNRYQLCLQIRRDILTNKWVNHQLRDHYNMKLLSEYLIISHYNCLLLSYCMNLVIYHVGFLLLSIAVEWLCLFCVCVCVCVCVSMHVHIHCSQYTRDWQGAKLIRVCLNRYVVCARSSRAEMEAVIN